MYYRFEFSAFEGYLIYYGFFYNGFLKLGVYN